MTVIDLSREIAAAIWALQLVAAGADPHAAALNSLARNEMSSA